VGAADPADIVKVTRLAREGRTIVVDGDQENVLPGIDLRLAADTHTYGSMYVTVRNDGARDSQDAWILAGDLIYT
jgi:N-acyl homoserine lactone hydrolase